MIKKTVFSGEKMKLYVASSWRNALYPNVIAFLRDAGFEVLDWRNPGGGTGFSWSEVDPRWQKWTVEDYRDGLRHPRAVGGFRSDLGMIEAADACVCLLPCGRSAHLEAGWFAGKGKPLFFLVYDGGYDIGEPVSMEAELMYLLAGGPERICGDIRELAVRLRNLEPIPGQEWRAAVLAHAPFEGDFGDGSERTLIDEIQTAKRRAQCRDCAGPIVKGDVIRVVKKVDGQSFYGGRYCRLCCNAMVMAEVDCGDDLEARIAGR